MALDNINLAKEIIAALDTAGFEPNDQSKAVWAAIAQAIIDHIKKNAEVHTTDSRGDTATGTIV